MHICKRRLLLGLSLIMGSSRLQPLLVRLPICNVFMVYLLGDYYDTCIPIGLHITRKVTTIDQLMRQSPRLFHELSADKSTRRKLFLVKCRYFGRHNLLMRGKNSRHTFQMMSGDDGRRPTVDTRCHFVGIGKALSVCLFLRFNGHFPGVGDLD